MARLKNFLRGWLLVLGLKEGLVEYATLCVKSEVILEHTQIDQCLGFSNNKTLINVSIANYIYVFVSCSRDSSNQFVILNLPFILQGFLVVQLMDLTQMKYFDMS